MSLELSNVSSRSNIFTLSQDSSDHDIESDANSFQKHNKNKRIANLAYQKFISKIGMLFEFQTGDLDALYDKIVECTQHSNKLAESTDQQILDMINIAQQLKKNHSLLKSMIQVLDQRFLVSQSQSQQHQQSTYNSTKDQIIINPSKIKINKNNINNMDKEMNKQESVDIDNNWSMNEGISTEVFFKTPVNQLEQYYRSTIQKQQKNNRPFFKKISKNIDNVDSNNVNNNNVDNNNNNNNNNNSNNNNSNNNKNRRKQINKKSLSKQKKQKFQQKLKHLYKKMQKIRQQIYDIQNRAINQSSNHEQNYPQVLQSEYAHNIKNTHDDKNNDDYQYQQKSSQAWFQIQQKSTIKQKYIRNHYQQSQQKQQSQQNKKQEQQRSSSRQKAQRALHKLQQRNTVLQNYLQQIQNNLSQQNIQYNTSLSNLKYAQPIQLATNMAKYDIPSSNHNTNLDNHKDYKQQNKQQNKVYWKKQTQQSQQHNKQYHINQNNQQQSIKNPYLDNLQIQQNRYSQQQQFNNNNNKLIMDRPPTPKHVKFIQSINNNNYYTNNIDEVSQNASHDDCSLASSSIRKMKNNHKNNQQNLMMIPHKSGSIIFKDTRNVQSKNQLLSEDQTYRYQNQQLKKIKQTVAEMQKKIQVLSDNKSSSNLPTFKAEVKDSGVGDFSLNQDKKQIDNYHNYDQQIDKTNKNLQSLKFSYQSVNSSQKMSNISQQSKKMLITFHPAERSIQKQIKVNHLKNQVYMSPQKSQSSKYYSNNRQRSISNQHVLFRQSPVKIFTVSNANFVHHNKISKLIPQQRIQSPPNHQFNKILVNPYPYQPIYLPPLPNRSIYPQPSAIATPKLIHAKSNPNLNRTTSYSQFAQNRIKNRNNRQRILTQPQNHYYYKNQLAEQNMIESNIMLMRHNINNNQRKNRNLPQNPQNRPSTNKNRSRSVSGSRKSKKGIGIVNTRKLFLDDSYY